MNTEELLKSALEKAEKELKDFQAQVPLIEKQVNEKLAYLSGKVDSIRSLMEPEKPANPEKPSKKAAKKLPVDPELEKPNDPIG